MGEQHEHYREFKFGTLRLRLSASTLLANRQADIICGLFETNKGPCMTTQNWVLTHLHVHTQPVQGLGGVAVVFTLAWIFIETDNLRHIL